VLELAHLSKTYADGTQALAGVSLAVREAEIVALVGGSGCGKTTLLRLIAGLDRASEGEVRLDGETIREPHPAVGIVFQEPRLLPWLSVAENVGFGLGDLEPAERRVRVERALAKVGLSDHARRWPRELSGGQQQRVAIARAFVTAPKVLLLDEPFSALDAQTRDLMQLELLRIWNSRNAGARGLTMVFVTHDIGEAVFLADRVVVLTARPARIREEIKIDLPRPRDLAVRKSVQCLEYRNYIWDLIRSESQRAAK
jgi:sulfonate transport system ATP-binding protein